MENLLQSIESNGWANSTDCVDRSQAIRLMHECRSAFECGHFKSAAVGRGDTLEVRNEIRGDHVMWIEPASATAEQTVWLATLEILRLALNRRFFFGLFDYEGHFAIYPAGGFYKPHLDCHAASSTRIVTVILYLNENWQPGDGGELKLWTTPGSREGDFILIEPRMGTLVCFIAADFWHEVLPALKPRMSITGWFRRTT